MPPANSTLPLPAGISVAMATCHGERFLRDQLESLAGQSLLPSELIVSDDRSDDATEAIVETFAARAPFPVRFSRSEVRLGYRANFMRAADLCRGDLIAFCDQDDVWEPGKLAAMEEPFKDPEVLLAYHNAAVIDERGRSLGRLYRWPPSPRRFSPLSMDPWALVVGFVQIVRRRLTTYSDFRSASIDPFWPQEKLAHDQWFFLLASVLGTVVRIPEPLAQYRQHGESLFGWSGRSRREDGWGPVLPNDDFLRAAENRVDLMARMESCASGPDGTRFREAADFYRLLAHRLGERRTIYDSPAPIARFKALRGLLKEGAYGQTQPTPSFGWGGLLLDSLAGVPLGRLAGRFLRW